MTDNETNTPILTPEQLKAIEYSKTVLHNLEAEISIAQKTLKQTKSESERAIKDKAYQEGLLNEISPKVIEKTSQINALNEEINNASTVFSKLQAEIKTKTAEQVEKDSEFQAKSDGLDKIIAEYNEKTTQSNKKEASLQKDNMIFNQKVAELKRVISTF